MFLKMEIEVIVTSLQDTPFPKPMSLVWKMSQWGGGLRWWPPVAAAIREAFRRPSEGVYLSAVIMNRCLLILGPVL